VPDSGLKEGSSVNLQLASSKGLYSISASARDSDDLTYSRLLRSVLINGAPLYAGAIINAAETEKISIAALSTHEDVLRALRMPDSRQRKLEKVPKGKKQNQEEDEKPIYSRSLAMLRKPRPGYTDAARMSGVQGTVVLQVTFLSTGEVGTIALVESLDRGLNNSAFSAAKRMKFLPAEIDGKPVDSVKNVEYSFWIY
jgi:TonB family protein